VVPKRHRQVANALKEVCVQPRPSAVNTTLPAFAAERRAAAPLLLGAGRCRSISAARTALSSKPAARRCCCPSMGQMDGRLPAS